MEVFVIHHIVRSRSVRRVSSGIFVFLLLVFVRYVSCYWWLTNLLIYCCFVFSFSLNHVQFLEEELFLSHLDMLSHTCFCPGGLACWFLPPDIITWFAAASAPYSGSCGSAELAHGCFSRGDKGLAAPLCSWVGSMPFLLPSGAASVLCRGSFLAAWDQGCTNGIGRTRWQKGFDISVLFSFFCQVCFLAWCLQFTENLWLSVMTRRSVHWLDCARCFTEKGQECQTHQTMYCLMEQFKSHNRLGSFVA